MRWVFRQGLLALPTVLLAVLLGTIAGLYIDDWQFWAILAPVTFAIPFHDLQVEFDERERLQR